MFLDLDWLSAGEFQELSVIFFPAWPNCDGNGDEVGPWSVVVDKHLQDVWYSAVRCWRRAWQGSWFVTDRWNIAQRWSRTCHNPYRCSRQWLWRRDWTSIFPRILDAGMDQWSFVLMRLLADLEGILLFGNIALQSTVTQYATRQRMLNCNLSRS